MSSQEESVWRQLTASDAVRQQQAAFTCATGLPLTLVPANPSREDHEGTRCRTRFCVEGCMGDRSGELCQRMLQGAEQRAVRNSEPVQFRCPTGLVKIIVPVVIGERHVGNLLAGPFSMESLNGDTLRQLTKRLREWGLENRVDGLLDSWRYSPVLSDEKGQAAATLLSMFSQYLAERGGRLMSHESEPSSPLLQKIEAYLAESQDDSISLKEIAERVHLSPCYFCKLFKKQTGLTFTEYRTRARVEKARKLLQNPHLRVSEVAFKAGFESIPYFNRAFRRIAGCSPTEYRRQSSKTNEDKKLTIQA